MRAFSGGITALAAGVALLVTPGSPQDSPAIAGLADPTETPLTQIATSPTSQWAAPPLRAIAEAGVRHPSSMEAQLLVGPHPNPLPEAVEIFKTMADRPPLVTLATNHTTVPSPAPTSAEPFEVFRGDPSHPHVALTFDCGPWVNSGYLNGILDALDEFGHRVTFFVTGQFLEKHGELFASRMARHEIANHSYSHPNFPRLPAEGMRQELRWTQEVAAGLGASTQGMWRAPFGARTARELWIAAEEGYPLHVMWSTDSGDWLPRPAERVQATILNGAENGAVIVMHCNSWQTAAVLGSVLWQLREWGIGVVTVSELIG